MKEFFGSSFRNQDLFYAELDAVIDDEDFRRRLQVVNSCLERQVHSESIIVHLEETKLTPRRLSELILVLNQNQAKIKKFCLVGVHGLDALRLRWKVRAEAVHRRGYQVINDLQEAKEWMVAHPVR